VPYLVKVNAQETMEKVRERTDLTEHLSPTPINNLAEHRCPFYTSQLRIKLEPQHIRQFVLSHDAPVCTVFDNEGVNEGYESTYCQHLHEIGAYLRVCPAKWR